MGVKTLAVGQQKLKRGIEGAHRVCVRLPGRTLAGNLGQLLSRLSFLFSPVTPGVV